MLSVFTRLGDISKLVGIRWPALELLLIAVAVFIYALLRVVGASASIPITLTFTPIIGNWTAALIAVTQPSFVG